MILFPKQTQTIKKTSNTYRQIPLNASIHTSLNYAITCNAIIPSKIGKKIYVPVVCHSDKQFF